ncbi:hypothetical protein ACIHDR_18930 [Nocardia sp. NPDC052278]|uniref:hypothetical protein n=1 Tax=unclassified Nocardia TaxID=2637762 RepID=UPI0036CB51D9
MTSAPIAVVLHPDSRRGRLLRDGCVGGSGINDDPDLEILTQGSLTATRSQSVHPQNGALPQSGGGHPAPDVGPPHNAGYW